MVPAPAKAIPKPNPERLSGATLAKPTPLFAAQHSAADARRKRRRHKSVRVSGMMGFDVSEACPSGNATTPYRKSNDFMKEWWAILESNQA